MFFLANKLISSIKVLNQQREQGRGGFPLKTRFDLHVLSRQLACDLDRLTGSNDRKAKSLYEPWKVISLL